MHSFCRFKWYRRTAEKSGMDTAAAGGTTNRLKNHRLLPLTDFVSNQVIGAWCQCQRIADIVLFPVIKAPTWRRVRRNDCKLSWKSFRPSKKVRNFPSELNWNKKHINILCDEYKLYSDELLINQTLWL